MRRLGWFPAGPFEEGQPLPAYGSDSATKRQGNVAGDQIGPDKGA
jgi:hypothetical protein